MLFLHYLLYFHQSSLDIWVKFLEICSLHLTEESCILTSQFDLSNWHPFIILHFLWQLSLSWSQFLCFFACISEQIRMFSKLRFFIPNKAVRGAIMMLRFWRCFNLLQPESRWKRCYSVPICLIIIIFNLCRFL